VVNDTANILNVRSHLSGVLDSCLEVKVNNVVAIVGHSDFVTIGRIAGGRSHSENGIAPLARGQASNLSHGVLMAERSDFDRNWEARSESVGKLGLVN
jgi:hypothetical protein